MNFIMQRKNHLKLAKEFILLEEKKQSTSDIISGKTFTKSKPQ